MKGIGLLLLAGFVLVSPIPAGSFSVDELRCIPNENNASLRFSIDSVPPGASVRLVFRRLNPVGAPYYNRARPEREGVYWSVLPKPEAREQQQLTDEWWEVLETRDWMRIEDRDRQWLEEWLQNQDHEAAEYFAAIYDSRGELVERSDVQLVQVLDPEECEVELDQWEMGWATNMTVGESTELQAGRPLFHWLCDGIVTRISADGVYRADEYCRACVVAAGGGVLAETRRVRCG